MATLTGSISQWEAYLLTLPRFTTAGASAFRPGLGTMSSMMEALGHPHEAFESVHVAGTNGKGSTASLLAAISAASGRRTGLHTSPHLLRINERLRLNGEPAPDSWLAHAVDRCRPLFDDLRPTFFEATTALAFLYFAECQVDLAIIEVGLGGRLDATNVLVPTLSIITSISLDHTDLLGRSIERLPAKKEGSSNPACLCWQAQKTVPAT